MLNLPVDGSMYNKLFTSILDSSIWLEDPPTKVVWVTLIAAMDEDGFAHFSAIQNLANRAVLSLSDTEAAVRILESPDPNSADKEFDGRRIERVPGGWMVLNARKYRETALRKQARENVRKRVQKHRLKQQIAPEIEKERNERVTLPPETTKATHPLDRNGSVTESNASEACASALDGLTRSERYKAVEIRNRVPKEKDTAR